MFERKGPSNLETVSSNLPPCGAHLFGCSFEFDDFTLFCIPKIMIFASDSVSLKLSKLQ